MAHDGPFSDDLYWLLIGQDGQGCAVPGSGGDALLERLQRLPRFDNVAVIEASASTRDATFTAWQGDAGEATVCAAEVDSPAPHA